MDQKTKPYFGEFLNRTEHSFKCSDRGIFIGDTDFRNKAHQIETFPR